MNLYVLEEEVTSVKPIHFGREIKGFQIDRYDLLTIVIDIRHIVNWFVLGVVTKLQKKPVLLNRKDMMQKNMTTPLFHNI